MPRKSAQNQAPTLRFPGFKGVWEEKRLGDCLDYEQPTDYIVRSTEYDDSYKTPVLTAGKSFILGYTNETDNIFTSRTPVIIFDDFTTASQFVDFSFKVKSSAMKILKAKNDFNIEFLYAAIRQIKYEVGGHGRHWISKYSKMRILVPSISEQQKIADFLGSVDSWIENLRMKKEAFESYKKGMMQKIFSQEIRFKDDNGKEFPKWEEKRLGEVVNFSTAAYFKVDNNHKEGYYLVDMGAVLSSGQLLIRKQTKNTKNLLIKGDLVMPNRDIGHGDIIGKVALIDLDNKYVLGSNMYKISVGNNLPRFIFYLINSEGINCEMRRRSNGTSQLQLIRKDVESVGISTPVFSEQQRIAGFLTSIDKVIESKQQQIIQAEQWKKGLMQGLFL